MNTIDIRLKNAEKQLLNSFIGQKLDSIDHDEFIFTNTSSQAVRINISGKAFYLYSFTEPLDYYGSPEEVAVWSVESTEYPMIQSKSFIRMPVHQTLKGISLVEEHQMLFENGIQTYDVQTVRGLILDLGDHQIAFEKPVWFSEDIIIRKGYDLIDTFSPVEEITKRENWEDGYIMKCKRTMIPL